MKKYSERTERTPAETRLLIAKLEEIKYASPFSVKHVEDDPWIDFVEQQISSLKKEL